MVDYTLGFTIQIDVYYDPATLNTSSYYNFLNGRGNNTGFHSGMMIPGLLDAGSFRGFWRNNSSSSVISTTGLTADWYRFSMIVTSTTVQVKLLNLRTNVELSGNIASVGTVDNADTFDYTFGCYGIGGSTGAYGTVGVNISNIKILRGSSTLLHIPLSEGHLSVVRDVISKTAYTLGFFSISAGWAKLADFSHYNFKNGFTLYTKAANPNIYVPNDSTGAEIPWTPLLSYVKGANYKGTTVSYNQCESKFKLDDVSASTQTLIGTFGQTFWGGTMPETVEFTQNGTLNGKPVWESVDGDLIRWEYNNDGLAWCIRSHLYLAGVQCYSYDDVQSPDLATTWFGRGGTDYVSFELQTSGGSDLYTADINRVLFDTDGTAKELTIQDIYSDVVDLTLDRGHLYINSDSDKNFMLYKTDKGIDTPADLKIWKYVK